MHARFKWGQGVSDKILYSIKAKDTRPVHADRVLKTKYRRFKDKEIRPKHERLRWDSMLTCQVLKNIKTFGMCVQGLGGRQDI